ncbi:hypothetical protein [Wohlfahrtiimonas chitiniclastica]|uniref:hypothetical protein n=1 Tax=Wohlfahrtiimonas chitiniclastica TaxID=400946 RepID=UPI001FEFCBD6|nr:hypothetical protein [Wohlfahrtiimonas chitiniclastica]
MKNLIFIFMVAGLASCSATNLINRNHPYQNAYDTTTKRIEVSRDHKVQPNCPIILSINDIKVGHFLANDNAVYHLKPDDYTLKARNCMGTAISNVNIQEHKNRVFLLSLDGHGHPMIVSKK